MIFQGIRTSIAKKPYIFVIFQGGVEPPVLPSGSAHDMPHTGTACVNNIVTDQPVPGGAV